MAARPLTKPRKSPHQDRAKATVDAILTATAHVLVKVGYDRASTNRVAEAAGVSIGSLYQYFPSKEALVVALVNRHVEEMHAVLDQAASEVIDAPVPVAVRTVVGAMMRAHAVEPELHKVFAEQLPRVGGLQRIHQVQAHVAARLLPYLVARRGELAPKNLEMAAFILVQLVESVGHASMHGDLGFDLDALTDEVTTVVLAYLIPTTRKARAS